MVKAGRVLAMAHSALWVAREVTRVVGGLTRVDAVQLELIVDIPLLDHGVGGAVDSLGRHGVLSSRRDGRGVSWGMGGGYRGRGILKCKGKQMVENKHRAGEGVLICKLPPCATSFGVAGRDVIDSQFPSDAGLPWCDGAPSLDQAKAGVSLCRNSWCCRNWARGQPSSFPDRHATHAVYDGDHHHAFPRRDPLLANVMVAPQLGEVLSFSWVPACAPTPNRYLQPRLFFRVCSHASPICVPVPANICASLSSRFRRPSWCALEMGTYWRCARPTKAPAAISRAPMSSGAVCRRMRCTSHRRGSAGADSRCRHPRFSRNLPRMTPTNALGKLPKQVVRVFPRHSAPDRKSAHEPRRVFVVAPLRSYYAASARKLQWTRRELLLVR